METNVLMANPLTFVKRIVPDIFGQLFTFIDHTNFFAILIFVEFL